MEQACREKPSVAGFCITSFLCAPYWGFPPGGTSEPALIKVNETSTSLSRLLWVMVFDPPRTETLAQTEIGTRSGVLLGHTWQVPLWGGWRDFELCAGKAQAGCSKFPVLSQAAWKDIWRAMELTRRRQDSLSCFYIDPNCPHPRHSEGILGVPDRLC